VQGTRKQPVYLKEKGKKKKLLAKRKKWISKWIKNKKQKKKKTK